MTGTLITLKKTVEMKQMETLTYDYFFADIARIHTADATEQISISLMLKIRDSFKLV